MQMESYQSTQPTCTPTASSALFHPNPKHLALTHVDGGAPVADEPVGLASGGINASRDHQHRVVQSTPTLVTGEHPSAIAEPIIAGSRLHMIQDALEK
jgi:hypothetical protein